VAFCERDRSQREPNPGEVIERRGEGGALPVGGDQFIGESCGVLNAEIFYFIEEGEENVFLSEFEFGLKEAMLEKAIPLG